MKDPVKNKIIFVLIAFRSGPDDSFGFALNVTDGTLIGFMW